jgi:hypothetical protein
MVVTPTDAPTMTATAVATVVQAVQVVAYGPDGISAGEVGLIGVALFGFGLTVVLLLLLLFRRSVG